MKASLVRIEVVKVDRETLRYFKFPLFVPKGSEEEMLKLARKGCNVGDFVVLPGKKIYRRIRGRGFRRASEEDLAELVTSQL